MLLDAFLRLSASLRQVAEKNFNNNNNRDDEWRNFPSANIAAGIRSIVKTNQSQAEQSSGLHRTIQMLSVLPVIAGSQSYGAGFFNVRRKDCTARQRGGITKRLHQFVGQVSADQRQ